MMNFRPRILFVHFFLAAAVLMIGASMGARSAAGLDCAAVGTPVERAISSDKTLSALDGEMGQAYQERLANLSSDEAAGLDWQQHYWLRFRAPSCLLPPSGAVDSKKLAASVACLRELYVGRIGDLRQRCEPDESKTIEDMARDATADWKHPYFSKVPKSFDIDQHLYFYVVRPEVWVTKSYNLPSRKLANPLASSGLRYPGRSLALCRVQAPNGVWWLANGFSGGTLSYTPEKDTVPAAQYDAQLREERARRQNGVR
jgi:uncharacterized protein YecT (DUF1311 family)